MSLIDPKLYVLQVFEDDEHKQDASPCVVVTNLNREDAERAAETFESHGYVVDCFPEPSVAAQF